MNVSFGFVSAEAFQGNPALAAVWYADQLARDGACDLVLVATPPGRGRWVRERIEEVLGAEVEGGASQAGGGEVSEPDGV